MKDKTRERKKTRREKGKRGTEKLWLRKNKKKGRKELRRIMEEN